ncbi:hypothetical protein JRQ81_007654 [Phrynocephalus forsythii]|uniref:Uncharacterized protein n=1 Tax=Phrynocephalus forsythii TaxID=171643 RepID=A0A9Q0XBZ3_9SAUR|nr:hypothetical protein JRQ81_007654 [Phrynocephalus forsythii]
MQAGSHLTPTSIITMPCVLPGHNATVDKKAPLPELRSISERMGNTYSSVLGAQNLAPFNEWRMEAKANSSRTGPQRPEDWGRRIPRSVATCLYTPKTSSGELSFQTGAKWKRTQRRSRMQKRCRSWRQSTILSLPSKEDLGPPTEHLTGQCRLSRLPELELRRNFPCGTHIGLQGDAVFVFSALPSPWAAASCRLAEEELNV